MDGIEGDSGCPSTMGHAILQHGVQSQKHGHAGHVAEAKLGGLWNT